MACYEQDVIFFEGYGHIEYNLYMATRNCHDCPITIVIPGNHDLFKFFQVVNEKVFHNTLDIIYIEPYPVRWTKAKGINKIFCLLTDIIKERRYLKEIFDKHFAELQGCEVFFHSRGFSGVKFYLLKKLSEKNRLAYISHGPPYMGKYTPTNIADLASLIILKLIYGHDIAVGKYPRESPHVKGFSYLPDEFMKKEVDKVINYEERIDMMKGFDLSQFEMFDASNYSVIYFDQGLIDNADYIKDKNTFSRELAQIFDILVKYFPEKEIALKYHPGYSSDKAMIKTGDVLPDFIPAELLYNDNVKMYLSAFSFSIANVERGLAVSICDLITFKDEKTKNPLREFLIQKSKSKILFPKSLDEFERILISLPFLKGED